MGAPEGAERRASARRRKGSHRLSAPMEHSGSSGGSESSEVEDPVNFMPGRDTYDVYRQQLLRPTAESHEAERQQFLRTRVRPNKWTRPTGGGEWTHHPPHVSEALKLSRDVRMRRGLGPSRVREPRWLKFREVGRSVRPDGDDVPISDYAASNPYRTGGAPRPQKRARPLCPPGAAAEDQRAAAHEAPQLPAPTWSSGPSTSTLGARQMSYESSPAPAALVEGSGAPSWDRQGTVMPQSRKSVVNLRKQREAQDETRGAVDWGQRRGAGFLLELAQSDAAKRKLLETTAPPECIEDTLGVLAALIAGPLPSCLNPAEQVAAVRGRTGPASHRRKSSHQVHETTLTLPSLTGGDEQGDRRVSASPPGSRRHSRLSAADGSDTARSATPQAGNPVRRNITIIRTPDDIERLRQRRRQAAAREQEARDAALSVSRHGTAPQLLAEDPPPVLDIETVSPMHGPGASRPSPLENSRCSTTLFPVTQRLESEVPSATPDHHPEEGPAPSQTSAASLRVASRLGVSQMNGRSPLRGGPRSRVRAHPAAGPRLSGTPHLSPARADRRPSAASVSRPTAAASEALLTLFGLKAGVGQQSEFSETAVLEYLDAFAVLAGQAEEGAEVPADVRLRLLAQEALVAVTYADLRHRVRAMLKSHKQGDAVGRLAVEANLRRLPSGGGDVDTTFTALMFFIFPQQPTQVRRMLLRLARGFEAQVNRLRVRDIETDNKGELSREQLSEIREIFGLLDRNGDGEISKEEFREIVVTQAMTDQDADRIFDLCADYAGVRSIGFSGFTEIMRDTYLQGTRPLPADLPSSSGGQSTALGRRHGHRGRMRHQPVLRIGLPLGLASTAAQRDMRVTRKRRRLGKLIPDFATKYPHFVDPVNHVPESCPRSSTTLISIE